MLLPIRSAPASSNVCTAQAWRSGIGCVFAQSSLPPPVGCPATSNRSLATKVSDESGPPARPSMRNCCPGTKAPMSSDMVSAPEQFGDRLRGDRVRQDDRDPERCQPGAAALAEADAVEQDPLGAAL